MKPSTYFAVASQQVATHPVGVLKLEATLNANATAGLFLQVHDANFTPSADAVPIKSWPAAECGYKEFKMGELQLTAGLFVALSTVAGGYTQAAGGNDKMDILSVDLTEQEAPGGTGQVGSIIGAGADSLQVWTDAQGPKRLNRIEVDNTAGTLRYLMLFASDSPANGDAPIEQWPIAAGAVLTGRAALVFGEIGREVYSYTGAGVLQDGCTLKLSSTAKTLTLVSDTNTKLKAEYHA